MERLFDEVVARSTELSDRGLARLVECADRKLAEQIATDERMQKLCMRAGERCLVVPSSSEGAFKGILRELGYLLAPDKLIEQASPPRQSTKRQIQLPSIHRRSPVKEGRARLNKDGDFSPLCPNLSAHG